MSGRCVCGPKADILEGTEPAGMKVAGGIPVKVLFTKQAQLPAEKRGSKRENTAGEAVSLRPSLEPHKSLTPINSRYLVWVGFGKREGAELCPGHSLGRKTQTSGQSWIQTWDWAVSQAIHWTWVAGLEPVTRSSPGNRKPLLASQLHLLRSHHPSRHPGAHISAPSPWTPPTPLGAGSSSGYRIISMRLAQRASFSHT